MGSINNRVPSQNPKVIGDNTTLITDYTIYSSIDSTTNIDTFRYTPTISSYYTFRSGTPDVVGRLYNSSGTQLSYDDDGAGEGRNFAISYYLAAGQNQNLEP